MHDILNITEHAT